MKKLKKFALLAVLLVACVATFCACNLIKDAKAISIKSMPKTSYVAGDTDFDWSGFVLTVEYNNEQAAQDFTYEELQEAATFTVSEFDGTIGTHTATIKYLGCSISFSYTVAAQAFAGGEGTEANPYQISTAEQFANIGINETLTYYVLINDLDMKDYEADVNGKDLYNNDAYEVKNAVIDGNNYAIRNLEENLVNKFVASTFKNVNIYVNTRNAIFYQIGEMNDDELVTLENINVYGVMNLSDSADQNIGLIVSYVCNHLSIYKGINVYADFITNTNYGAIFVGYNAYKGGNHTFEDCKFYGYAQGRNVGLYIGNAGNVSGTATMGLNVYIKGESGNYGTMVTTENAPQGVLFADAKDQKFENRGSNTRPIKFYKDATELKTQAENEALINNGTAKRVTERSLVLGLNADNQLTVTCENNSVASYKVIAEVWAYNADSTRTNRGDTNTYTLLMKEIQGGVANEVNTGVYLADWVLDENMIAAEPEYKDGKYFFNDYQMFNKYFFKVTNNTFKAGTATNTTRLNNVRYTVFAYDVNGMLLGSYTYGLTTYAD